MNSLYAWTGRLLRVDLSSRSVSVVPTSNYLPDYVGGLGIAARIAWDELQPGVGPFDPDNLLFLMVGPLTGTLASGGGRVVVAGIAPQQRPSVFSRSSMGGHWGAELKFAGYDGIIFKGASESPAYLWIDDDTVEIRDADDLWGTGTYQTTNALRSRHGTKTRVISCGQAGENLCRIACIQTETGNAAGQGGFGAVMGSKKLKAVAVQGSQGVKVADPERLFEICLGATREGQRAPRGTEGGRPRQAQANLRRKKCGFCMTNCAMPHQMGVPGEATPGPYTGNNFCYSYPGSPGARIEAHTLTSDFGLNGWEVGFGIIPWLQMCKQKGLIDDIGGLDLPVPTKPLEYRRDTADVSGELLVKLLRMIALREGELGDALADGACYAGEKLFGGQGAELLDRIYPRRAGQTAHWVGHWGTGGNIYFPFWLTPILQWAVDSRDPASDATHSYSTHMLSYLPIHGPDRGPMTMERARAVCEAVYGDPDVCNPDLAYEKPETKAWPAILHHNRGFLVECLVLCDREHMRVFSLETEDNVADQDLIANLYSASTGHEVTQADLDVAADRVFNLLRAIDIRNHARDRKIDWYTAETLAHPAFTDGISLDLDRFSTMLDTYYRMRGWDPANGWPTRTKLEALGLTDVADALARIDRLGGS